MLSVITNIIAATLNSGTPLLIAGIGILIHERSGVLNLGIEGIMLIGAVAGFGAAISSGSFEIGFLAGAGAGLLMALIFGFFTIALNANQYVTGLAVTILGSGLSAMLGQSLQGLAFARTARTGLPFLKRLPVVGDAIFSSHPGVYLAIAGIVATWWFLYRTQSGLVLRAVGENPKAAAALGYPVRSIRFAAVLFGGTMSGLAGAYLSLVYTPLWAEGMTAGRGWIALALVTFATWRPLRVALGAFLFGGVTMLQFNFQAMGVEIPSQVMSMAPYLATILALVLISRNPKWIAMNRPASLGKTFSQ